MTFDDYLREFKKMYLYSIYLNGGRCGEGPSRDELKLRQTNQFGDLSQMANVVVKYTSGSSFINRISHL